MEKIAYKELTGYPSKSDLGAHVLVEGVLSHIFYQKDDFAIVELEMNSKFPSCLTAKGAIHAELVIGQTYQMKGVLTEYNYELQLKIAEFIPIKPVGKRAVLSYLQTLDGVKESRANLLYTEFGEAVIDVILTQPERVAKVKGIGKKFSERWREQLQAFSAERQATMQLLDFGLTGKQASALIKKHGDTIVCKVESNPYCLQQYVRGFGFAKADAIAFTMGQSELAIGRLQSGIVHWLEQETFKGHCFVDGPTLIQAVAGLLARNASRFGSTVTQGAYESPLLEAIEQSVTDGILILEDGKLYLRKQYASEVEVANHIKRLTGQAVEKTDTEIEAVLDALLKEKGLHLESKQREAVIAFNRSRGGVYILNGSAGTGKTFTFNLLLEVAKRLYPKGYRDEAILAVAPTGKAAKVAQRSIGMECQTIHRALGYQGETNADMTMFNYNNANRLPHSIVACDETSMIDIELAQCFFSAIETGTKVILMGDTKQLPSVGAGNVLADLIQSERATVITLSVVKRQASLSGVLSNATNVIESKMIETAQTHDFFHLNHQGAQAIQQCMLASVSRLMTKGHEFKDIQVLVPQRIGGLGSYMLNYLLQKQFNQYSGKSKVYLTTFDVGGTNFELYLKPGDKVIHTKNNYAMDLYTKRADGTFQKIEEQTVTNGETGVVVEIEEYSKQEEGSSTSKVATRVIVQYDDFYAYYEDGVQELELAYAITIHKSQGSSWKNVVLPMSTEHQYMLSNNLIYTAITRAEAFAVVIGQKQAIWNGIQKVVSEKRRTFLKERLTA